MTTKYPQPCSRFTTNGLPKRRFDTRAEAKAFARCLAERHPENKDVDVYRCSHCGYFHNGTYPTDDEARAGKRAKHRQGVVVVGGETGT